MRPIPAADTTAEQRGLITMVDRLCGLDILEAGGSAVWRAGNSTSFVKAGHVFRPSTTYSQRRKQDVDARHKARA